MSLTERMIQWVEANSDRLQRIGPVTVRRSSEAVPKPSAQLVVSAPARLCEVIVWDSGEVELTYGTLDDPRDDHHEINDPAELDRVLDQLLRLAE